MQYVPDFRPSPNFSAKALCNFAQLLPSWFKVVWKFFVGVQKRPVGRRVTLGPCSLKYFAKAKRQSHMFNASVLFLESISHHIKIEKECH